MAINFSESDFENVRKAIDISLTKNELGDDIIDLDVYKGEAVSEIERATATLTDEQKMTYAADIKRAAILLTAAFVTPRFPVLTSETLEGDKQTFQSKDLFKLADELRGRAFGKVSAILQQVAPDPTEIDTSFVGALFSTAKARSK